MATPEANSITLEEFQVILRRAGLDLGQDEMEHLLPIYQQLAGQLRMLHDAGLPLGLPADAFRAEAGG